MAKWVVKRLQGQHLIVRRHCTTIDNLPKLGTIYLKKKRREINDADQQ